MRRRPGGVLTALALLAVLFATSLGATGIAEAATQRIEHARYDFAKDVRTGAPFERSGPGVELAGSGRSRSVASSGGKRVRVRQSAGPFCVFVGRAFFTWAVKKFGKKQATRYVKPGRARGPIRGYTRHGLKRAITGKGSRPGIQPKYIHHAVRHGKQTRQAHGKIKYETRDAVVVLTHGRKVVTTWPKSLRAWNCYICG